MDFAPTDEQRMIVETVRAFVESELAPHEDEVERSGQVPRELASHIRAKALQRGLFAPNMPEELGGGGLDPLTVTMMDREFGRTSYALHYIVARPSNILLKCRGEQVERYLKAAIRGDKLECVAMTEPEAGSDVRSMKTTAVRDGDDYVINGVKHFISKADIADFVILFAATGSEDSPRGPRSRITAFLVDMGTQGFTLAPGYDNTCHRGYHNSTLVFEDCRVPASQVLGEDHKGFDELTTWLASTRLQVAAMAIGRAQRALELAKEYAASRRQFGQPIGRFQGVGFPLADMATELRASELLVLETAWRMTEGTFTLADAAMAKLAATETLGRIADAAVQIFGGMGLMKEMAVERIWRDARIERIWDGTSEIQRHIIARDMLRPLGG